MTTLSLSENHGLVVDDFATWSAQPFLLLNVLKTKDMIIKSRKSPPTPTPFPFCLSYCIELADNYKYLGMHLNNKLCLDPHVIAICKKVRQHPFFPQVK